MARIVLTITVIFLTVWKISICSYEFKKISLDDFSKVKFDNVADLNVLSNSLTGSVTELLPSESRSFTDRLFKTGLQDDAEANLRLSDIVDHHGYTLQSHDVQTDDGYIITHQRIPYGKNGKGTKPRQPVLIQNGLFYSSAIWVLNNAEKNLAYILADAGYDVWLGNVRGSSYGRKHVKYSTSDDNFWKYSWDEMAKYDTPKIIDKMLKETNYSQILYVGHSMGSTIALALLSSQTKYNNIIKGVFALAPVAQVKNARGLANVDFALMQKLSWLFDLMKSPKAASIDGGDLTDAASICSKYCKLCASIMFLICGVNPSQFNEARAPAFFHRALELPSLQNLLHFVQMHNSDDMTWFDHGAKTNLEKYGQEKPPVYPVKDITAPVALLWSDNDFLADPKDVGLLSRKLPSLSLNHHIQDPSFSHLDFMFGKDSKKLVYDKLLDAMKELPESDKIPVFNTKSTDTVTDPNLSGKSLSKVSDPTHKIPDPNVLSSKLADKLPDPSVFITKLPNKVPDPNVLSSKLADKVPDPNVLSSKLADKVPDPSVLSTKLTDKVTDPNVLSTKLTDAIVKLLPTETRTFVERLFKASPSAIPDDPEGKLRLTDIVGNHGYPIQSHDVQTDDGYTVTVHRIPYGKSGKGTKPRLPVLIQHGLSSNSAPWLLNTPDNNLAYILADAGHDVWLGNVRGSSFGCKHNKYPINNENFWKFSWDDMAKYDIPKIIDTMLKVTNSSQIFYVGHSMGSTIALSMLSTQPKYNDIIKGVYALAPIAQVKNARGLANIDLAFIQKLSLLLDLVKSPITASQGFGGESAGSVCNKSPKLCASIMFLICGINPSQFNEERAPLFFRHGLELPSMQILQHFLQMYNSDGMSSFDYGAKTNMEKYGQETAPAYQLKNIKTPVSLMWSDNDFLADSKDVGWLSKTLPSVPLSHHVQDPSFSHLDFMWGKDSKKLVYDKLLEGMNVQFGTA